MRSPLRKEKSSPSKAITLHSGFTFPELIIALCIISILASVGASRVRNATSSTSAAKDKFASYLALTRAEAITSGSYRALIISTDASGKTPFQRYAMATLTPATAENTAERLTVEGRWNTLPKNIVLDTLYTSPAEPNAYHSSSIGPFTLSFKKEGTPAHPAVQYILFDKHGSLVADNGTELIPFSNSNQKNKHKGAFIFLRKTHASSNEQASKIYLSPLTGNVCSL